jgi:hypothetical protein
MEKDPDSITEKHLKELWVKPIKSFAGITPKEK